MLFHHHVVDHETMVVRSKGGVQRSSKGQFVLTYDIAWEMQDYRICGA